MTHVLGIDVGGTFTDLVAFDRSSGTIKVWRELSVPADPVAGIIRTLCHTFASQDTIFDSHR